MVALRSGMWPCFSPARAGPLALRGIACPTERLMKRWMPIAGPTKVAVGYQTATAAEGSQERKPPYRSLACQRHTSSGSAEEILRCGRSYPYKNQWVVSAGRLKGGAALVGCRHHAQGSVNLPAYSGVTLLFRCDRPRPVGDLRFGHGVGHGEARIFETPLAQIGEVLLT